MKETQRQQFRWQPHASGASAVKPRDYEEGATVDAPSAYAAWKSLRGAESFLRVGDLLESETGELRIYKYVGFEEAQWVLPEMKQAGPEAASPPA